MPERSPVRIAAAKAPFWPGIRARMCAEAAIRSRKASCRRSDRSGSAASTHRGPGIADRADPLEPGDAPEVEAAGLRRAPPAATSRAWPSRRRPGCRSSAGVAGSSETRTRAGRPRPARGRGSPPGRAAPAAGRSPSGRGRSPGPRRSRSSRAAAPAPRRSGCAAPPPRSRPPAAAARAGAPPRDRPVPDQRRRSPRRSPPASAASIQACGSDGHGEVERDPEPVEHRDPEREVRALRLDQGGEAVGAHVPCSPVRNWPKTSACPSMVARRLRPHALRLPRS